jgi:hypothetical protein
MLITLLCFTQVHHNLVYFRLEHADLDAIVSLRQKSVRAPVTLKNSKRFPIGSSSAVMKYGYAICDWLFI